MSGILQIIYRWLINGLIILGVAYLLPGVDVPSFYIALILALIFGLLNAILKPVIVLLTLPINILTLGLFTLVINGALFWIPSTFIEGFIVVHFGWAVIAALIVSILTWVANQLFN